ncbi:CheR family methyltransferase [Niveispirillum sp. KHB5.9]|uniref:CheR family methyltransferase n=1 Tax=Niveispirillum sp. KHB5.9 TaxID=3400269 RepID=UPI003A83AE92
MRAAMPPAPPEDGLLAISDAEFDRFCDFIYRRTGMSFGENRRYFVDRRLRDRIQAAGHASFRDYFVMVMSDAREYEQLVSSLTVNETYFYREDHQFRCLTDSVLPRVTARKRQGDTIRLWSLPCATGEEPYSIAIWLLENWPSVDDWQVEIMGSDIDTHVVQAAMDGFYHSRSLMRLPPDLTARYFSREAGGQFRVIPDLRDSIRFSHVNVMDRGLMAAHGRFDVIFCRNMLIYFDEKSRREAIGNLYDCLEGDGFVFLGHAESMSRVSSLFQVRRFDDAIIYQKPAEGAHG